MIWFQMFKRFISTNCFAWAWSKRRVTHFPLSVYYLYQKVTLLITLILDILKSNPLRNRFHVQARTIFNWLVLNVIRDFTSQGHLRLRGQTKPKRALVTCGSACLRRLTCFLPCVLAGSWWQYPFLLIDCCVFSDISFTTLSWSALSSFQYYLCHKNAYIRETVRIIKMFADDPAVLMAVFCFLSPSSSQIFGSDV